MVFDKLTTYCLKRKTISNYTDLHKLIIYMYTHTCTHTYIYISVYMHTYMVYTYNLHI